MFSQAIEVASRVRLEFTLWEDHFSGILKVWTFFGQFTQKVSCWRHFVGLHHSCHGSTSIQKPLSWQPPCPNGWQAAKLGLAVAFARMELHRRVPADRWCVTKAEFFAFVAEVKVAWRQGLVPNTPTPGPHEGLQPDLLHHSPAHGPNLYQVNQHFVKPKTLAGMSYALLLHPEGLPCHVFVSHAWAEGIFELSCNIQRAWPYGFGLRNMYCCLLANPQNLDMELFLGVDPLQNPFALALQRASHILVIPNSKISIYSRLWCVYEAYLGTTMNKVCIMPVAPKQSAQCTLALRTIVMPFFVGILAGLAWGRAVQNGSSSTKAVDIVMQSGIVSSSLGLLAATTPFNSACRVYCLRCVHMILITVSAALIFPWSTLPSARHEAGEAVLHFFLPVGLSIVNVCCVAQLNLVILSTRELAVQAKNLSCQSVCDAHCSHPVDEDRIRLAIDGSQSDVDTAIHVLMLSGAYTQALRRAYDSGQDIHGAGVPNFVPKAVIGGMVWFMAAVDSIAMKGAGQGFPDWVAFLSAACAIFMVAFLPVWAWLSLCDPSRLKFALNIWTVAAICSLALPLLVAIVQGWEELQKVPVFRRINHKPAKEWNPSWATWIAVCFARPLCASSVVALLTPFSRPAEPDSDLECDSSE